MADRQTVVRLEELAHEYRAKFFRLCYECGDTVHIGGDLSSADIMVALYNYKMTIDPANIRLPERDRFVLSKGHGAACMHVVMAMRGFFDYEELVRTYGKLDSAYGMHPCKVHLPGVESSAGSLGHGLPVSVGMALAARCRGESHRVFCLMGDGETCEGSIWEAAQVAASKRLGNLVGIVDRNRQLMTTYTEDEVVLEPYADKWRSFGWRVIEVNDGNDMGQIVDALDSLPHPKNTVPTLLLLNTIKGKGLSFAEGKISWHAGPMTRENYEKAMAELEAVKKRRCS